MFRGGSSPACSCRYRLTQVPSVPSFTCISRATSAIGRTELPALLCHVLSPPFWTSILWGPLSENFGAPHVPRFKSDVVADIRLPSRAVPVIKKARPDPLRE